MAFSKILVHSKTIKNAKKLSTFGENDSCCLTNFLHISRTYNQINCRNIWFAKVTIILIMMAQVLFSIFFPKKTRTLMSLRFQKKSKHGSLRTYIFENTPGIFRFVTLALEISDKFEASLPEIHNCWAYWITLLQTSFFQLFPFF